MKLNSAFATRKGVDSIGIGSAVQDCKGKIIAFSYSKLKGSFSAELGNILAMRDGLSMVHRFNLTVEVAEISSSAAVLSLNSSGPNFGDSHFINNDIRALLSLAKICKCKASSKKGNSLAYSLALLTFSSIKERGSSPFSAM